MSSSLFNSSSSYRADTRDKEGVKALEEETAREMIDKLTKYEGNESCADCGDISKPC